MNFANTVNLYSGKILFGDPTQPWNRKSHHLPIPNLSVTAYGTNSTATISTLAFPNYRSYEIFEPSTIKNQLQKTLVINAQGTVTYETPKLTSVSTQNSFFSTSITSFTPNTIAGPNIKDAQTQQPDTVTNALAKLDDWLKNAFLIQPPAVTQVEREATSLYAGVRWNNFLSYNILNGTMPHVTSILLVIGDPSSDNLTFEWSDPSYFPLQQYTNGVSPVLNPLVQLRVFADFTPPLGDASYTKAGLENSCFHILNNSGACALPSLGPVFTIEKTDHISSYTTLNIYLPNLTNTYSKDSTIPIRVVYMNKTNPNYNVSYMSTTLKSTGGPSAPAFTVSSSTFNGLYYSIQPPAFSDAQYGVTEPYNSTYTINYNWLSWSTVKDNTSGFLYGAQDPSSLPSFYAQYVNTQSFQVPAFASTLNGFQTGSSNAPFLPGANWSTTIQATNLANIPGAVSDPQSAYTFFPTDSAPSILSTQLQSAAPFISKSTFTLEYTDGWAVQDQVPYDIAFVSTPTQIPIQTSSYVQLNNSSYPGDRNIITVVMNYGDQTQTLNLSTSQDTYDYAFSTPYMLNTSSDISVDIQDTQPQFGHLFYQTQITGLPILSTQQSTFVSLSIQNTRISNGIESSNVDTSAAYGVGIESVTPFVFIDSAYLSTVTSTTYVSGLLTPALGSYLQFTASQSNQVATFAGSTLGAAVLQHNSTPTNESTYITSTIYWVDAGNVPYTSLPLPQNTQIYYSSLNVAIGTTFQDPADPRQFEIFATLTPPYPQGAPQTQTITIGSNMFADTISQAKQYRFTRLLNFLPRSDIVTTDINIRDGVSTTGATDIGLNVSYSTFVTLNSSFSTFVDNAAAYDNTQDLSQTYPNYYSRELMTLGGKWTHPTLYDFSTIFKGDYLVNSSYVYPDFTYDLVHDQNYGFRYATFLFSNTPPTPTPYRFANITINNPSALSTISAEQRIVAFPNSPVDAGFLENTTTKLHLKLLASYQIADYQHVETSWINGFKYLDDHFDDSVYDIGGCAATSTYISSISYKVAITPRYYTNIAALVRVGISRERDTNTCEWLTFTDVNINFVED